MAILAYCSNCCQRGAASPDSQLRGAPDQQSFCSEFRANGESFAFNGCALVKCRESQKRSGKSLRFGSVSASPKIGTEFRPNAEGIACRDGQSCECRQWGHGLTQAWGRLAFSR